MAMRTAIKTFSFLSSNQVELAVRPTIIMNLLSKRTYVKSAWFSFGLSPEVTADLTITMNGERKSFPGLNYMSFIAKIRDVLGINIIPVSKDSSVAYIHITNGSNMLFFELRDLLLDDLSIEIKHTTPKNGTNTSLEAKCDLWTLEEVN